MPSPFPGMDPYIECQGNWQDFHNALIAEMRSALGASLPGDYVARVDERIEVVGFTESEGNWFKPDVLVARRPGFAKSARPSVSGGVATLEPIELEVRPGHLDEIRETWLEIRRLPDLQLITVVEVLSPSNKAGPGRLTYLEKRDPLHAQRVHLVEIDLLLGGHRTPMAEPLTGGDYYAIITRAERFPVANVYAWSIRRPLPKIPVPLRSPDPDALLDLANLVQNVYDLGRYDRTLRYQRPLPDGVPLAADDRSWAEEYGNEDRKRDAPDNMTEATQQS